jgi:hypothetical protein
MNAMTPLPAAREPQSTWHEALAFRRGATIGALVLTIAGGAWAFLGLANHTGAPAWAFVAFSAAVFTIVTSAAVRFVTLVRSPVSTVSADAARENARRGRRVGIVFGLTFAAEGVLIGTAATLLQRADRPLLIPVAVAAIFGLHLLPLGKVLGMPIYNLIGSAIAGLSALALLVPDERARVFDLAMVVAVLLLASAGRVLYRYS